MVVRNKMKQAAFTNATDISDLHVEFERFDRDHNGMLSYSEFSYGLRHIVKTKVTDDDVNILLQVFDPNRDGVINYHEFTSFFSCSRSSMRRA